MPPECAKIRQREKKKHLKKGIRHDRRHFVSQPYLEILYKMLTGLLSTHQITYNSTRLKMLPLALPDHRLPSPSARGRGEPIDGKGMLDKVSPCLGKLPATVPRLGSWFLVGVGGSTGD